MYDIASIDEIIKKLVYIFNPKVSKAKLIPKQAVFVVKNKTKIIIKLNLNDLYLFIIKKNSKFLTIFTSINLLANKKFLFFYFRHCSSITTLI